jgi:hypothetical protein
MALKLAKGGGIDRDATSFRLDRATASFPAILNLRSLEQRGNMLNDYVKAACDSRAREIEAAIHRFRDCGVEIERFSIEEHPGPETRLCIDGVPRFIWKMVCDLPNWRQSYARTAQRKDYERSRRAWDDAS